jgi:hypothetical protein
MTRKKTPKPARVCIVTDHGEEVCGTRIATPSSAPLTSPSPQPPPTSPEPVAPSGPTTTPDDD